MPATVESSAAGKSSTQSRIVSQALAQEQAAFERKMSQGDALFRLQLAMGWMTFLIVPASVFAVIAHPAALLGAIPINGAAAWNWRRMLQRRAGEIEPVTKLPDLDE